MYVNIKAKKMVMSSARNIARNGILPSSKLQSLKGVLHSFDPVPAHNRVVLSFMINPPFQPTVSSYCDINGKASHTIYMVYGFFDLVKIFKSAA